jgi:hypothetical protein
MDNFIKLYTDFLNEAESTKGDFKEFSEARLAGATKITESAKEKGGTAMLTYHHFVVKLPYYKKAAAGKFDLDTFASELDKQMAKLSDGMKGSSVNMKQTDFQRTMGIIEVLGELIIRHKGE